MADRVTIRPVNARRIPNATVDRLPVYHRILHDLQLAGDETVSSERLAELAGVNAAKVRKDLSYLGSYGTRGVGYDIGYLKFEMSQRLGLTSEASVAIVGLGNLGRALANHAGFRERGFPVAALFDVDPAKVGSQLGEHTIRHLDDLASVVATKPVAIGVIATPPGVAQQVADQMAAAGVKSILNFAPVVLTVPHDVSIRRVDLTVELQVLSFYQQRDAGLLDNLDAAPSTPADRPSGL